MIEIMEMETLEGKARLIADTYGLDKQSDIMLEECAELIKAICKYKRYGDTKNLKEEMGDLRLTLMENSYLLGAEEEIREIIDYKADRTINLAKEAGVIKTEGE